MRDSLYEGGIVELKPHYFPSVYLKPERIVLVGRRVQRRRGKKRWLDYVIDSWKKVATLTEKDYLVLAKLNESKSSRLPAQEIRLYGWYLAEGDLQTKDIVRFNIGKHETEYMVEIRSLLEKLGYRSSVEVTEGALRIWSFAPKLAEKLATLGKGAERKHLPEGFLDWSREELSELIDAYWKGDGCFVREKRVGRNPRKAVASVSELLIRELQFALLKLGKAASFGVDYGRESFIKGRRIKPSKTFRLVWKEKSRWLLKGSKGNWFIKIAHIRKIPSKDAMNILTEDNPCPIPFVVA
jgi:intein/homing endonuclease